MNAAQIEKWISFLGQTYEDLLLHELVPDEDFIELFPGDDEVYLEPIVGVSMSFSAETERLRALFITLRETAALTVVYEGDLPKPYSLVMNQADVHAVMGKPWASSGPIRLPVPIGQTGGWESYLLDPQIYPNTIVNFQYLESMDVKVIVFRLADTGKD